MEATPLRPVPASPAVPVEPALALRHLGELLPLLSPGERDALAFVALAGRSRADAAAELGIAPGELARRLASARKALRQTLERLPGDGLCERAERLISDRLDDVLDTRGATLLDAHLRSCERCVTHERRLGQAHDRLVAGLAPPAPAVAVDRPPLRVVQEAPPQAAPATIGRPELLVWYALWTLSALAVVLVALLGAAGLA
jgi:Putative zinc-finger/Sigma-70, region 4